MLDIDHFKIINDTYGHICGDLMLVELAKILRQNIRGHDQHFRYGGEEFALFLIGTDLQNAKNVAENLLEKIRNFSLKYSKKTIKMTASAGVLEISPKLTVNELVKKVDLLLYEAKATGRDRVCFKSKIKKKRKSRRVSKT
jgi:diguanylate cyclase (GGDEF)-like protein